MNGRGHTKKDTFLNEIIINNGSLPCECGLCCILHSHGSRVELFVTFVSHLMVIVL